MGGSEVMFCNQRNLLQSLYKSPRRLFSNPNRPSPDDMDTIKTMFTPLMKEDRMKHIDYKTFNSIQQVKQAPTKHN